MVTTYILAQKPYVNKKGIAVLLSKKGHKVLAAGYSYEFMAILHANLMQKEPFLYILEYQSPYGTIHFDKRITHELKGSRVLE